MKLAVFLFFDFNTYTGDFHGNNSSAWVAPSVALAVAIIMFLINKWHEKTKRIPLLEAEIISCCNKLRQNIAKIESTSISRLMLAECYRIEVDENKKSIAKEGLDKATDLVNDVSYEYDMNKHDLSPLLTEYKELIPEKEEQLRRLLKLFTNKKPNNVLSNNQSLFDGILMEDMDLFFNYFYARAMKRLLKTGDMPILLGIQKIVSDKNLTFFERIVKRKPQYADASGANTKNFKQKGLYSRQR